MKYELKLLHAKKGIYDTEFNITYNENTVFYISTQS